MGRLSSIIAQLDDAETGVALAVSPMVPRSFAKLVACPRPYHMELVADERSVVLRLPDLLRRLSVLEDPVAETHAEWLIGVIGKSQGCVFHGSGLRINWVTSAFHLTDEGRAWLVRAALSLIDDDKTVQGVCSQMAEQSR